MLKQDT